MPCLLGEMRWGHVERRVAEVSVHGHVAGVWMGNIRGGAPRLGHVACRVVLMLPLLPIAFVCSFKLMIFKLFRAANSPPTLLVWVISER
jgi:hypothetical protein